MEKPVLTVPSAPLHSAYLKRRVLVRRRIQERFVQRLRRFVGAIEDQYETRRQEGEADAEGDESEHNACLPKARGIVFLFAKAAILFWRSKGWSLPYPPANGPILSENV